MKTATFFAFASLLAGAFATPVASPAETADVPPPALSAVDRRAIVDERGEVVKRVEGVHLLNCADKYSVILVSHSQDLFPSLLYIMYCDGFPF